MFWSIIFHLCRSFVLFLFCFLLFIFFIHLFTTVTYCQCISIYQLINKYLLIYSPITLKVYLVYPTISIFIPGDLIMCLSFSSCHQHSFEQIIEVLTFPINTTDIVVQNWHLILLYYFFHRLHFATTLRMLKPVLYFHMASIYYIAKRAKDIDTTSRCHQNNVMPDRFFSVTCG